MAEVSTRKPQSVSQTELTLNAYDVLSSMEGNLEKWSGLKLKSFRTRLGKRLRLSDEEVDDALSRLLKDGIIYSPRPGIIRRALTPRDLSQSSINGSPAAPAEAPEQPESTSSPRLKGKQQSRTAGTRPTSSYWASRQSFAFRKFHEQDDKIEDLDKRLRKTEAELEKLRSRWGASP